MALIRNITRESMPKRLEQWAQKFPEKGAWHWYDDKLNMVEAYTYKELDLATSHLADYMRNECGLKTGDVAILCFLPGLPFTISLLACFKAGVIGVPVYPPDPTKAGKELLHFATIVKDCGAKVALTHNTYYSAKQLGTLSASVMSFFAKRDATWPELNWFTVDNVLAAGRTTPKSGKVYELAEIAFLQYTSGSTSAPKGVMITHQNLAANSDLSDVKSPGIFTSDCTFTSWLPQYHDLGLMTTYMMCIWCGGSGHYMSPISFLKNPLLWLRLIALGKARYTVGPCFAFGLVLRKMREATEAVRAEIRTLDLSSVQMFSNGAEPLEPAVFHEFLEMFEKQGLRKSSHCPCYGLAEHTLAVCGWGELMVQVDKSALLNERRIEIVKESKWKNGFTPIEGTKALVACGKVFSPENAVRIVDPETFDDLGDGKIGEIWVDSDSKAKGYWGREDTNDAVFKATLKSCLKPGYENVKYLRTGDLGFIHNNEIFYTGRLKDVIIINGLNYYPQDIERAAESSNAHLSAGRSAAFAVRGEDGALTDACVIIAELRLNVDPSNYAQIVDDIIDTVSRDCGLLLQGIYLIQPKTILKTTSGKISRNFNAQAYANKTLKILHQWEDFEHGPAAPVASFAKAPAAPKPAPKETPAAPSASSNVKVPSVEEVQSKIALILRNAAGTELELQNDTNVLDLGLNSVAITELSNAFAKEFGVRVRPMTVFSHPTLRALSEVVQGMLKEKNGGASATVSSAEASTDEDVETEPVWRSRYEAHIAGWGFANPLPIPTWRFSEVEVEERRRLGQSEETINAMLNFVKSSQIQNRYYCQPYWLPKGKTVADYPEAVGVAPRDIYGTCENHIPKYKDRLALFTETAFPLCIKAAERAVDKWGQDKQLITHIITTCTTGWTEPGIGCAVINGLGLREDIQKQELNFNGCFCGASCLRMARDFIRAGEATAVLVVACEVSSNQANPSYTETELLVMESLFADGAAAIVVAREGIWRYDMTGSAVMPESKHLLGLRPPLYEGEDSYVMTLSKYVAPSLYKYFTGAFGKTIMKKLYNGREPRSALAVHPGGPRILEAMGDVFGELGFKENALDASYNTYRNFGNLGCAAMLFVLSYRLDRPEEITEDSMITMAFGPGVTVEWAKLVRSTPADRARQASLRGIEVSEMIDNRTTVNIRALRPKVAKVAPIIATAVDSPSISRVTSSVELSQPKKEKAQQAKTQAPEPQKQASSFLTNERLVMIVILQSILLAVLAVVAILMRA